MKSFILVSVLMLSFYGGAVALECYSYQVNSYDGVPANAEVPSLTPCAKENAEMCVTLAWTSNLPNAGAVKFEEGMCTTKSVCQSFCTALYIDSEVGHFTRQCQQQCCNHPGCNVPKSTALFNKTKQ